MLRFISGDKQKNEKLDQIASSLLEAWRETGAAENANNNAENKDYANNGVISHGLQRRIFARIENEKRRRLDEGRAWSMLLLEARHVLPVLAMIAVAVMGLAIYNPDRPSWPVTGRHHGVTSVLIVNDIQPFSNDEMMASAVSPGRRGK